MLLGLWRLLADVREPALWAAVCSVVLRDLKQALVSGGLELLQGRHAPRWADRLSKTCEKGQTLPEEAHTAGTPVYSLALSCFAFAGHARALLRRTLYVGADADF